MVWAKIVCAGCNGATMVFAAAKWASCVRDDRSKDAAQRLHDPYSGGHNHAAPRTPLEAP